MRVVIVARRERPITRPGQVEKVLDKFKIAPASHAGPGPISWMSTWSQNDDGSQIELEIVLHDDAQAPSLISELRACGFVRFIRQLCTNTLSPKRKRSNHDVRVAEAYFAQNRCKKSPYQNK